MRNYPAKLLRSDLSDWLIHFVHDATMKHLPEDEDPYVELPDFFDAEEGPVTMFRHDLDSSHPGFYSEDPAFSILLKILRDGFIKSTWSFRNGTPTIYGNKSTVCFTEMPLYAFVQYAASRKDTDNVSTYALGFLKKELFKSSVRPVIYGLTEKHLETEGEGLRCLDPSCGIGLEEQYRYVAMNLDRPTPIDWTHEREWRWGGLVKDICREYDVPGLPLFSELSNYSFSRLIVVVENTVEAEQVIKLLVTLHDSAGNDYYDFRANALLDTRVLALSELSKYTSTNNAVRLDDLPYHTLPRVSKVVPSQATILKVRAAVAAAGRVWDVAATNEDARTPVNQRGDKLGPCGFGSVITFDSNSEITQALLAINAAEAIASREGYMMFGIGKHFSQILLVNEAGARAAAEFLTTELGQAFFPDSHLD